MGENGPSEHWPYPLHAGISKEKRKKLESFGKGDLDANGPNLSNKGKGCIVRSLEKQMR